MTIQPIGDQRVAVYITPADLRAHGLTPESLTAERALALTRDAFTQAGLASEGPIEIDAYPDDCGVLLFAHVRPPERLWLSFPGLEPLLAAAHALPAPPEEAALLWWEGRYWLSLPAAARQAHAALSEFGATEAPRPYLDARLAEHGRPILRRDALAVLARFFPG